MQISSYMDVLDDHQHVEASQRGLRFRDEVDKDPAKAALIDTDRIPSNETNKPTSIDATTSPSIDTRRLKKFDVCGNLFDEETTTRSDKSGGKKRRNWKKRRRTKGGSQLSLIPHFSDGDRKSRVRNICFSKPFENLRRHCSKNIDRSPLNCVDQQSFKSIDRHFIVSIDTHINGRCLAMDGEFFTVKLSSSIDTRYSFELSFQCHWFEVNQHPIAKVMFVLLKSGQSASREEVVEEMKDCRSTVHPCRRSTVMPEYGLIIFYDRLKPRSNTNYQNTLGRPKTLFKCFLSHC
ncbi:hypothetical protein DY000_02047550 [Brassica cretica]|uniref:SAWADEE domain-containing protein n=1 Tax=Brassica cretica TaxID=69181 RepID=A0ABQ7F1F0_BRACR|nr:hypothetical protein DY000_02047550 [Brassica cretica]